LVSEILSLIGNGSGNNVNDGNDDNNNVRDGSSAARSSVAR
jgi:hypothetical protein